MKTTEYAALNEALSKALTKAQSMPAGVPERSAVVCEADRLVAAINDLCEEAEPTP